jgi:hypothetical protein
MEDNDLVTIVHGDQQWNARSSTLRNCSIVLDELLRDSDIRQPRTINMDDVSVENVVAFLLVAKLTSYDSEAKYPSVGELSEVTSLAMPLVHKYDCKALLQMLQSAQNVQPNLAGIMSILKHEPESTEWMGASVKRCLLKDVLQLPQSPCEPPTCHSSCRGKIAALPPAVLSMLFAYSWLDLTPNFKRDSEGRPTKPSSNTTFRNLIP